MVQKSSSPHKVSWEAPEGIRFNRFGRHPSKTPYLTGASGQEPEFWLGWRSISEQELDELAEEIVAEVEARGPFRSMAEFVNRNPWSSNPEHQRKGALQAALDRVVNKNLPNDVGEEVARPSGSHFSAAMNGENEAAGHAGYLTQGDVLQSLAPLMQARSDYFRIRASGEAVDASGKVIARAWCEAFVQRIAEYVNPSEPVYSRYDELKNEVNKTFGRRFELVSFRWLAPTEI